MFIQNLELEFYRLITYYHVKLFEVSYLVSNQDIEW